MKNYFWMFIFLCVNTFAQVDSTQQKPLEPLIDIEDTTDHIIDSIQQKPLELQMNIEDSTSIDMDSIQQKPLEPQMNIEDASYTNVQKYILAGIDLGGDTKYSKAQITRFTGLTIGEEIELPGSKINNAIKKLWRTKLFSDIDVYVTKVEGKSVYLKLQLVGLPELSTVKIEGVKKSHREDFIKKNKLEPGKKITSNLISQTKNSIKKYYRDKGFPDTKVSVAQNDVEGDAERQNLLFTVDRGPRVKIKDVVFEGNKELSSSKLRSKGMKNTRRKSINFFRSSKLIPEKYREDLKKVSDEYKSIGFRDARIVSDTVIRSDKKNYLVKVKVEEGKPYYLGDVTFTGNSVFTTDQLNRILSYKKGDRYDAIGIDKKISGSEKDDDIHTQYMDLGYLFSQAIPIEKSVKNDTIDLEVKIIEGEQATINRVTFTGNSVTYDHVIARELRTKPGDLFSKSEIKRTLYELASLGYFEPTEIVPDIQPNPSNNTVDIDWKLSPKSSSQIELQGGYGGGTFLGTLGLTFGNFSIRNLIKGKAWKPVPMGDGQSLSLRAQAGSGYQNYSISFIEPWIGGRRPTALSLSLYYSKYHYRDSYDKSANLDILGTTVGLSKLLTWPDDYFRLSNSISYQRYAFDNYNLTVGNLNYQNGTSNNLNYTIGLSRLSAGPDPVFPQGGSDVAVSFTTTFPYSLVNNRNYDKLSDVEKYEWLEYYKVKANAYWFKEIMGKLVLRMGGEVGFLGRYNDKIEMIPFERFYMGGTGLTGSRFDGREIIPLRGYEDATNSGGQSNDITPEGGGVIYNKFLMELRYPITMGQQAKIYGLGFLEAGNTWSKMGDFKPFELKRSAGVGIRIFMAAFGLLGFDFGYGFDNAFGSKDPSGWQTHFIIGQQL